ncbi:MAG: methionine gamma-lyase family protein [Eubacteriales bacterium]|nr:methionine gamma-lyase family protein [Eubacteriales bacterium]MDD4134157.1 methionine gamma-lyase family protein [Eubacteriales bacterium]
MTTIEQLARQAEEDCREVFRRFEAVEAATTGRVLDAFESRRVEARHFTPSNGYGYGDLGRDTLEALAADIFRTPAAILRPQISGGTHTLALCLFGLLLPGDELLSATGKPYDTLTEAIGFKGEPGSLQELGVSYRQVELSPEGGLDTRKVLENINGKTRVVFLQRSRGYTLRDALSPACMAPLIRAVKEKRSDIYIVVDNCYGAFVCEDEPSFYGADAVAGSLIKNLGGGLAPTGGYIAGSREAIERIAARLTAPGLGREVGSYEGSYRPFYQGLFMAPHTVCQALKVAAFTARMAELTGLLASPSYDAPRGDIIQALILGDPQKVIAYCRGIQSGSPVDAHLSPEPWDMPGYEDRVIMAAGAFVQGASIELSCDAPMREPFAVYQQGGLTWLSGRRAVLRAFSALKDWPEGGE